MTALVAVPPGVCPTCGNATRKVTTRMAALLRHGGYGATATTVVRWCPACAWSLTIERSETRPEVTP